MTTLLIISYFIFSAYVLFIAFNYGVQPSISDSWYKLPDKYKWVFTLVTWGYTAPLIAVGVTLPFSYIAFLSGLAIMFVGAAPSFKNRDLSAAVHKWGAVAGITLAMLFFLVNGMWYIPLIVLVLSALTYHNRHMRRQLIWWVEVYAYLLVWIGYIVMVA